MLRPHRFDLCVCDILSAGRKEKSSKQQYRSKTPEAPESAVQGLPRIRYDAGELAAAVGERS